MTIDFVHFLWKHECRTKLHISQQWNEFRRQPVPVDQFTIDVKKSKLEHYSSSTDRNKWRVIIDTMWGESGGEFYSFIIDWKWFLNLYVT